MSSKIPGILFWLALACAVGGLIGFMACGVAFIVGGVNYVNTVMVNFALGSGMVFMLGLIFGLFGFLVMTAQEERQRARRFRNFDD